MFHSRRESGERILRRLLWPAIGRLSFRDVRNSGFILGCGRSGTTIFGEILGTHPAVLYLNEPRHIWGYESRTDVWSKEAQARGGRLRLGSHDVRPGTATKIRNAFRAELAMSRRRRLIEKLPANSFRVDFLRAIFPDARFIHLIRNGVSVARSIAKQMEEVQWYGENDYKWRLLAELARENDEIHVFQEDEPFVRGLIEWKLAVSEVRDSTQDLPDNCYMEVRFEDLLEDPTRWVHQALAFLELDPDPKVERAALQLRSRTTPLPTQKELRAVESLIGDLMGELGYGLAGGDVIDSGNDRLRDRSG